MLADVIRAALAVGILGGLALASYAASIRLARGNGVLVRWLACVMALAWVATALFHLLAALRGFTVLPAFLAVAGLVAVSLKLGGGVEGLARRLRTDAGFARRIGRRIRKGPHRRWVFLFAALAAPLLLRATVLPPMGWDTLVYRGVKAAMWVQGAGTDSMIGTGPWGYYRNMLGGGEVVLAWAMLPLRADTLTGVVDVVQWLSLGLAVLVLARELGAREPYGSACAGFVLSLPTVAVLPGSGYVELLQLATLGGAMALGLRGLRGSPGLLVLAGAGFGVCAGTKLPMIPLCGVLLFLLLVVAVARGARGNRAAALAASIAFLVALGPWLLIAYHRTGAILSPLPVRIGPFVLGHAADELAWMMSRPIPAVPWFVREIEVLGRVFHPPLLRSEALGLGALLPLAAAPFGLIRLARRNVAAAAWIACAALVAAALYFSPGLLPVRIYWPLSSSRFLLPLVMIAAVATVARAARPGGGSPRLAKLLRALAVLQLAGYVGYGWSFWSVLGAGLAALGVAATWAAAARAWRSTARGPALALVACTAILLLSTLRDGLRDPLFRSDFVIHRDEKPWAVAIGPVDEPDRPRTLAVTGGPKRSMDNWFAYPFLGRRLQNRLVYVPVAADGAIRPFGDRAAMETLAAAADFEAWARRLEDGGVTEVMSFAPASLELAWMERRPDRFERVSGDAGEWGLYRLRRGEVPADSPRGTPGS